MKIKPSLPPTHDQELTFSPLPREQQTSLAFPPLAAPLADATSVVDAFQRLLGAIVQAPQATLQAGNEEEIAAFLKNGQFDQKQLLTDLRTVANSMTRMPAGQELLLASGPNGQVSLSPSQGVVAEGGASAIRQGGNRVAEHVSSALGDATLQAAWNAKLGGQAHGRAQLDANGLQAQGQAWAGGTATGELQGTLQTALGDASVNARGEATGQAWAQGQVTANLQEGLRAHGQAGAEARLGGTLDASVHNALLQSHTQAKVEGVVGAKGQGDVKLDATGLQGKVKLGARAEVAAQVTNDTRSVGVLVGGERLDVNSQVKAVAHAGAKAGADVDVAATIAPPRAGIEAEAGVFAGAKAGVEGKIGLGDFVSVKGKAEAWAGAGAQAGLIAGLKDGKLRFGFHAGAAAKAGAGFKWSVEVDVQKIAKAMVGGSLEAMERGLDFALDPMGTSLKTADEVLSLLQQKRPGTLNLGASSPTVPLSPIAAPLLQQSEIQQQAAETIQQAVTEILGADTSKTPAR